MRHREVRDGNRTPHQFAQIVKDARQFDAAIGEWIDDAVARADFSSVPLPDFASTTPNPHRVLADLAARAQLDAHPRDQVREVLAHLKQALEELR